jgi:3-isopropylmalate/(R)-2-methylmalate dehydratase small subunit
VDKFTTVSGLAAPLLRSNIDTDVIVRIERMIDVPRDEMGRYAFESLRYRPDGLENPDFVLNRPQYRGTPLLLAGDNFGCGSSREAAVWALKGLGIRCVIAPSFGGIFFDNCFKNGLLPVTLDEPSVRRVAEQTEASANPTTVDLVRQVVVTPHGEEIGFTVDSYKRQMLLDGLDDIGVTLRHAPAIAAWQAADRARRPWAWDPVQ